jgi:hypothetical protein
MRRVGEISDNAALRDRRGRSPAFTDGKRRPRGEDGAMRLRPVLSSRLALLVVFLALAGVTLELVSGEVRSWLSHHPFTSSVLVGVLLIAATYLVVERVLAERERRRWGEATRPLIQEIGTNCAAIDRDVRAGKASVADCDRLVEWLDRFLPMLTGTPELIARWRAARSFAQHARGIVARGASAPDDGYGRAWARFEAAFADVYDFTAAPQQPSETWMWRAVDPGAAAVSVESSSVCPRCGRDNPPDADFCPCGEYLRWEPTALRPAVDRPPGQT